MTNDKDSELPRITFYPNFLGPRVVILPEGLGNA